MNENPGLPPLTIKTFDKLDPSKDDHFEQLDAKKVNAIWALLVPAIKAREPAYNTARKLTALMHDKFLEVMEENQPPSRTEMSTEQQEHETKRMYYQVNLLMGQSKIREGNYASVPTEFVAQRLTLSEQDHITVDVATGLANRYYSPQLERGKRTEATGICWQGHMLLHLVWDPTLGPVRREAVETNEPESVHMLRGPDRKRTIEKRYPNQPLYVRDVKRDGIVDKALKAIGQPRADKEQIYQKMDEWGNLMFNEIPTGLPRIDILGPMDYVIDPLAREGGIIDARFAAVVKRVDAAYLYEQFGDDTKYPGAMTKLAAWKGWSSSIEANEADRYVRMLQGTTSSTDGEQTGVLVIFYMRPAPQLGMPRGLYAIAVADKMPDTTGAGTAIVLYWDELPAPHIIPLFDGAVEIPTPYSFYGQTYNQKLAPLNHQLNRIYGYIDEAASLAANRALTAPAGMPGDQQFRSQAVVGMAGTRVIIPADGASPGQAIAELKYDGSGLFQMQFLREISGAMEAISNTHGPQATQRTDLAVEVMANLQRDESVAGQVKQGIAKQWGTCGHYFVRWLQLYLTTKDLMRLLPDYTEQDIEVFKSADLSEHSSIMRLRQTTLLSNNPALRNEFAKSLVQLGERLFEVVSPDEVADLFLGTGDYQDTVRQRQRALAARENSRMRVPYEETEPGSGIPKPGSGPDPESLVDDSDVDPIHIAGCDRILGDPRRDKLPVDYLTRVGIHRKAHMAQLRKKLIEQLTTTAAAQATARAALTGAGVAPEQGGVPPPPQQQQQKQGEEQ